MEGNNKVNHRGRHRANLARAKQTKPWFANQNLFKFWSTKKMLTKRKGLPTKIGQLGLAP